MRNAAKHLAPILLVVAASALFAAGASGTRLPDHPDQAMLSVLKAADRVEVYRVDPRQSLAPAGVIGHTPIVRREKDQGTSFARRIGAALSDDKTYSSVHNLCMMEPAVGYRIWSGKRAVSVLICFKCNILELWNGTAEPERPVIGYFGKNRAVLVRLAKESFPDDPIIQALKG